MKRIRYSVYEVIKVPDIVGFILKNKIEVKWVIEAGCHDGSDTIRFLKIPSVLKIYAFEPDSVARQKALVNCSNNIESGEVEIFPFALVRVSQEYEVLGNAGELGTGSSQVVEKTNPSNHIEHIIQGKRLDEVLNPEYGDGLLWLDVEGGALEALEGAKSILNRFAIIQVEVEFQDMWGRRKRNFDSVIALLEYHGFTLLNAAIYPGLFGDLLFVRRTGATTQQRLRSVALKGILSLLHKGIYPVTHKNKFKD
jgi:FkbM family methyltransferase